MRQRRTRIRRRRPGPSRSRPGTARAGCRARRRGGAARAGSARHIRPTPRAILRAVDGSRCANCRRRRDHARNRGLAQRARLAITRQQRQRVYARDGRCCVDCGATDDLTVDHLVPLALDDPEPSSSRGVAASARRQRDTRLHGSSQACRARLSREELASCDQGRINWTVIDNATYGLGCHKPVPADVRQVLGPSTARGNTERLRFLKSFAR